MAHSTEGICDICGSSGLVGDGCPCGGVYHDLNVGVDDTLIDDEPDAYPQKAMDDAEKIDDVVSLESLKEEDDTADEIE